MPDILFDNHVKRVYNKDLFIAETISALLSRRFEMSAIATDHDLQSTIWGLFLSVVCPDDKMSEEIIKTISSRSVLSKKQMAFAQDFTESLVGAYHEGLFSVDSDGENLQAFHSIEELNTSLAEDPDSRRAQGLKTLDYFGAFARSMKLSHVKTIGLAKCS